MRVGENWIRKDETVQHPFMAGTSVVRAGHKGGWEKGRSRDEALRGERGAPYLEEKMILNAGDHNKLVMVALLSAVSLLNGGCDPNNETTRKTTGSFRIRKKKKKNLGQSLDRAAHLVPLRRLYSGRDDHPIQRCSVVG